MNEFDIFRNERIRSAGGRAVQAYYGYISCPTCGSKNVEPSWAHEGYMQCNNCGEEWLHPYGNTVKRGRKTITTTHGRYPVSGYTSDKAIMLMMMPYEKLESVHDSNTGKPLKKGRKIKRVTTGKRKRNAPKSASKKPRTTQRKSISQALKNISTGTALVGDDKKWYILDRERDKSAAIVMRDEWKRFCREEGWEYNTMRIEELIDGNGHISYGVIVC